MRIYIYGKKEGRDETRIAEEVARLYQSDAGIKEYLRNVMTSDNLKTGMEYYVAQQKPELIQLARKLGIVDKAYISELKKKLSLMLHGSGIKAILIKN